MRRIAFALLLALAPGCGPSSGVADAPAGPRNLLLVLLDTTRSDHLSCYGHDRETTPVIDGLAAQGVRFESVFAQSSLTPVSAGTLLSGALPFRHGVRSLFVVGHQELSPDVSSLFELLGRSGRRTAGFVSAKPMGSQYGLARGFDEYHDDLTATKELHRIARFGDAPQRPADETAELVLDWLERHGREPFALLFHMFDAHDPTFVPPREFLERHLSFPVPAGVGRYLPDGGGAAGLAGDPRHLLELYDAELSFMDLQLGRVLALLEQLGVRDETLVVVLADHGEAFGEHDFYTHGLLYREHLQVPLVLQGPGVPAGRTVAERARVVDVLPTLIELMHLPPPAAALDGESLVGAIQGGAIRGGPERDRDVYAEVHHAAGDSRGREAEMYTLVSGRWKYVHRPQSGHHELFDLESDPEELVNLYAADHPEAQKLRVRLLALGAVDGAAPSLEGIDPAVLEELRAMGYL